MDIALLCRATSQPGLEGIINDPRKPETQTGLSGGGGGRNPPGPSHGGGIEGEHPSGWRPSRERTKEDDYYWQTRQEKLPFPIPVGVKLKPHEIEFAEQFIEDGFSILRWLPEGHLQREDGSLATSPDFEWLPGVTVELKRSNKYRTIKGYIQDGLAAGKETFIIDFGGSKPRDSILRNLTEFSSSNGEANIFAYWNGTLVHLQ